MVIRGIVPAWCQLLYGDGYGHGHGDGDGDGHGYGDDEKLYWINALSDYQPHAGSILAFWRSDENGQPANGGTNTKAKVGLIEEITGPLKICTMNALHGTTFPPIWKGDRLWVVELYPPFQFDGDKIGALKRRFVADITAPKPPKE